MKPFNGAEPIEILAALRKDHDADRVLSFTFRAIVPHQQTRNLDSLWRRFKLVVGCPEVYAQLGIFSLPLEAPATLHYTFGLEVVGTLANLLVRSTARDEYRPVMQQTYAHLERALNGQFQSVEAFSCSDAWCDWFEDDLGLNATTLIGSRGEWWLLVVTEPNC